MRRTKLTLMLSMGLVLMTASNCNKPPVEAAEFDKSALLTNIANNCIIPSLADFEDKINVLEADYITFQGDRTDANLTVVKESWKQAYIRWQTVKMYDFGPLRNIGFKGAASTFPTDTTQIDNNIVDGTYNLASADNADAIGFPSLDYLLYKNDALNHFTTNENYTTYGLDIIQKMKSEISSITSSWTGYKTTFIASTGTETTSAFSELINEFNRDYELAKNAKIGIPLGKQSLGIQLPDYIEARKSGISFELLRESISSIQKLYNGDYFNSSTSDQGFYEYLKHLERDDLADAINTRFNDILNKIDSFSGTFEDEMSSNVSGLDELYSLIQGQVVNLKTDMTSAFGVLITYQDNDGD
ncbi:MAG: imelysin family protein [Crocinitomicaceae bacterium]|nr:imelysin family protein [Crocinitomicaceae bacterium]